MPLSPEKQREYMWIRRHPGKVHEDYVAFREKVNIQVNTVNSVNRIEKGSEKRKAQKKTWLKLDHSVDKGQIILKESHDGFSWKTVRILTKGEEFEHGNVVIAGTWHKGSVKEGDTASS